MKKRLLALGLVAAMAATLFAGCGDKKSGGGSGSNSEVETYQEKSGNKEDVTITWWLMGGNDEYYQYYWSEMKGLKQIQENIGVNIEFKVATSYDAYLPMMAAQNYPHVITAKNLERYNGRMAAMHKDGVSVDLQTYIDAGYMDNFKKIIEDYPDIARDIRLDDGSYTFVSQLYDTADESDRVAASVYGTAIREDWLEVVGLDVPTNMSEWYQVLSAFKTQDPNGNGQQDEEPVCMASSGWKYFLPAYGIDDDPSIIKNEDGTETVIYGFMTSQYKEYLQEMNKWYQEGLIYNMFEKTSLEARQERVTGNFAGAWKAEADHFDADTESSYLSTLREKAPDAKFAPVPWPKTADGYQWCFSDITSFNRDTTIITSNAVKDGVDEAAAYLIDYMLSEEGSTLTTWGIEGESYEVVNDGKQLMDGMDAKVAFHGTQIPTFNTYADPTTIAFPSFGEVSEYVLSQKTDEYINACKTWSEGDTGYKMMASCQLTADQQTEIEDITTQMKNYVTKMRQRFITGKEPLTNYDNYIAQVELLGGTKYSEIWSQAYDSYKTR